MAMTDINEKWLEQSSNDLREIGGDGCVLSLVMEVSEPDSVQTVVNRTIGELDGLHILVNNAGIYPRVEGATDYTNRRASGGD